VVSAARSRYARRGSQRDHADASSYFRHDVLLSTFPTCQAITLTFTPNGLGNSQEPWLLAPKENSCVGCGVAQEAAMDGLMRWSVVPPSFRSLLPEAHKSRDSHDIVLLCRACHAAVVGPYDAHRARLFADHGIAADTARTVEDPHLSRVRSAARALSGPRSAKLPAARRLQLEAQLCAHYGVDTLTPETLARAASVQVQHSIAQHSIA
jgi:hypothetical protein